MYDDGSIKFKKIDKIKLFLKTKSASWLFFGLMIILGLICRLFFLDYTSSDIFVWKEAADMFLNGENPYVRTLESFQQSNLTHFYAYFPLWLYISSLILTLFPNNFFLSIKILIVFYDLQLVTLLLSIFTNLKINHWRMKFSILCWYFSPMVIMTSTMHGKFDSLMLVFMLLAVIFHKNSQRIPEAIFLSLAIMTKTIVLIFVPLFFFSNLRKKEFKNILEKITFLVLPLLLVSIPFLKNPVLYFKGILGVHITREGDLGLLFTLLQMIFQSEIVTKYIKLSLTMILVIFWIVLLFFIYLKNIDLYNSIFYLFILFNCLYWVLLIQYIVWDFTFYIIAGTKSRLKNWQFFSLTSFFLLITTISMYFLGLFVKNGL